MTVREMIKHLKEMPQDMKLYTSSDDEGNSWFELDYAPYTSLFTMDGFDGEMPVDDDEAEEYDDLITVVII